MLCINVRQLTLTFPVVAERTRVLDGSAFGVATLETRHSLSLGGAIAGPLVIVGRSAMTLYVRVEPES